MRYIILTLLVIGVSIYIFLVLAVNDDKRWFHDFSKSVNTENIRLKTDSIQYSAYRWRKNSETSENELYIAYYIKINKNGRFIVMRHNTTPEPALYFKGEIQKPTSIFFDSLFKGPPDTSFYNEELNIYDGNTFNISYTYNKEYNFDFNQINASVYLKKLMSVLDDLVFKSNEQAPIFDLSDYRKKIINRLKRHFPKEEERILK